MVEQYTRNGTVALRNFYVDDTNGGEETHFKYSAKNIESLMKGVERQLLKMQTLLEEGDAAAIMVARLPPRDWFYYAAAKYASSFDNAQVAVFGSMEPFAEATALALGAAHVTTIEYNNLTLQHERLSTLSKHDFSSLYSCTSPYLASFDVAISLSSFDHDGLGRYGDPLDPDGDLKAMRQALGLLKPGGLLFLTVPLGLDLVVFNLLRRYGALRLPLLLQHWQIQERLFWDEEKLTADADFRRSYEPVFMLRKPLLEGLPDACTEAGPPPTTASGSHTFKEL